MTTSNSASTAVVDEIAWRCDPRDPQDVRLLAALLDAHRRLSALVLKMEPTNAEICKKLLRRADIEAGRSRYVAWDCLHQLDEETLAAMSDEERTVHWCTLRAEADEKLRSSWRGKAIECLEKLVPETESVSVHVLRELQANVAIASQNQQHKLELFEKRTLPVVRDLLGIAVVGTLTFSVLLLNIEYLASSMPWAQALGLWTKDAKPLAQDLLLGVPAGALGGILSMAFALGRADLKAKIPDMRLSRLVTLIRPLIGATVAIPVVVLVQGNYVKVAGFEGSLAIFAFCFLGGFSERWFLGVMERFEAGRK